VRRSGQLLLAGEDVDRHTRCTRRRVLYAHSMADEREEPPDLAERQAEIAAAMDETIERQREIQRRQDELLDHLGRLSRAMDGEAPPEPPREA
jgi:hypothetical protein